MAGKEVAPKDVLKVATSAEKKAIKAEGGITEVAKTVNLDVIKQETQEKADEEVSAKAKTETSDEPHKTAEPTTPIDSNFTDDSSSNGESTPSHTIKMWSTKNGMDYYQLNEKTILEYVSEDDVYHLYDFIKKGNTLTLDSITHNDTFTMTINDLKVGKPVTFTMNEDGKKETVVSKLDFVGDGRYSSSYYNGVIDDAEYISLFKSGENYYGVDGKRLITMNDSHYLYNEASNDTILESIGMYDIQDNNLYLVYENGGGLELNIGNMSTGKTDVYYLDIA